MLSRKFQILVPMNETDPTKMGSIKSSNSFMTEIACSNYQEQPNNTYLNPPERRWQQEEDARLGQNFNVYCNDYSEEQKLFQDNSSYEAAQAARSLEEIPQCFQAFGTEQLAAFSPIKNTSKPFGTRRKQEDDNQKQKKAKRLPQSMQVGLLSGLAFINSPREWCSLREIYAFLCKHFIGYIPYKEDWKKSIRHSLCTYDMYERAAGDGNWKLKDKTAFFRRLDAYLKKNPRVEMYGLHEPHLWEKMRNGTLGLPINLSEEEEAKAIKKRRAAPGERSKKRRCARDCDTPPSPAVPEDPAWLPQSAYANPSQQFFFGTQQDASVEEQIQLSQQLYYAQLQTYQGQLLQAQLQQYSGHWYNYQQPSTEYDVTSLQENFPNEDTQLLQIEKPIVDS